MAKDLKGPHAGSHYPNVDDDTDLASFGDGAGHNKGGCGDIQRQIHPTVQPGDVDRAAREAQAESDAAYRALVREVGGDDYAVKQ